MIKPDKRNVNEVAALVELDKWAANEVIKWAWRQYDNGTREESLLELTDLDPNITSIHEVKGPLALLLAERKQPPMTKGRAGEIVKWVYLRDIADGDIDPRTGITGLIELRRHGLPTDKSLDIFYQIDDALDDSGQDHEALEREIVDAAKGLISSRDHAMKLPSNDGLGL